jgi:hypothetical protein
MPRSRLGRLVQQLAQPALMVAMLGLVVGFAMAGLTA